MTGLEMAKRGTLSDSLQELGINLTFRKLSNQTIFCPNEFKHKDTSV